MTSSSFLQAAPRGSHHIIAIHLLSSPAEVPRSRLTYLLATRRETLRKSLKSPSLAWRQFVTEGRGAHVAHGQLLRHLRDLYVPGRSGWRCMLYAESDVPLSRYHYDHGA